VHPVKCSRKQVSECVGGQYVASRAGRKKLSFEKGRPEENVEKVVDLFFAQRCHPCFCVQKYLRGYVGLCLKQPEIWTNS
jgi:hypothetical protein